MSKRNSIIIILAVLILVIAGLLWVYFYGNEPIKIQTEPINTQNTNPFGDPSGNNTNTQGGEVITATSSSNNGNSLPVLALRQIYSLPVSGSVIFLKNGLEKIRYVDRATGNIYETTPDSFETVRLTNNTVPKIQEAVWANSGENLIMRYLKEDNQSIDSFSAKIKITGSSSNAFLGEITGNFLTQNSITALINPSSNKVFVLTKKSDGTGVNGFISNLDNSGKTQIFDSKFSEWTGSWPKNDTIAIATKASGKNTGYLYFLNSQTGQLERIMGDMLGLSFLANNTATGVLYSEIFRNTPRLGYYDVKNESLKNLSVPTFAEKCIWSAKVKNVAYCAVPKNIISGLLPDLWYQGIISFSDSLWKIDVEKGTTEIVYEFSEDEDFDIVNLNSISDSYFTFINKKDLSLWGLKVNKE